MNHRLVLSSALASALALGLVGQAPAQGKAKEKCYGISKAGTNDCGNLSGTHTCAGQSKTDDHPGDWRYVPKGSCRALKGLSEEEARAKLGL
ncbi:MAG: DUF2282 domain-containing protein [Pseudomonadota bacterium]